MLIKKWMLLLLCLSISCSAMQQPFQGAYSTKLKQIQIAKNDSLSIVPEYDQRTLPFLKSNQPGVYVPGLGEQSAKEEMFKYKKAYASKQDPSLLYPDNLIVYDAPDQGKNSWCRINKGTSFGKTESDELVKNLNSIVNKYGIKKVTLFPICRGATTTINALYTLLKPSEDQNRKTMDNLGMNSTDCKKILHAINPIVLQCPMQKVDDSVELIGQKVSSVVTPFINTVLPGCSFAKNIVSNSTEQSLMNPIPTSIQNIFSYVTLNGFLPIWSNYSPKQQKPVEMLSALQGLKQECPNLKILMTAKAKDTFIGSDPKKIEYYFNNLPAFDDNKYLLSSPATSDRGDINHVTLHNDVKLGWHSFLKKAGASYFYMPDVLKKGNQVLDNARAKQQQVGIQKYLTDSFEAN